MQKNILLISVICLFTGFVSAYFLFDYKIKTDNSDSAHHQNNPDIGTSLTSVNPFLVNQEDPTKADRLNFLENEVALIKQQVQQIQLALDTLATSEERQATTSQTTMTPTSRLPSLLNQQLYNIDNLIKGGIDPLLAEDIVRRKNSIELKRLELQDRATRENYLNTQQYFDELAEINRQDINLRDELGDDRYDAYLFTSKQNNRIRITSVMLESAAEQAGILSGDIVLSYDNKRMFTWQELKEATAEGQLGEYVSITIYRDGQIYSFSVPRGPLGVQLGAARLEP